SGNSDSGNSDSGNSDSGNSDSGNTTTVIYKDNFESAEAGWKRNPNNNDSATKGQWEFGNPQTTSHRGMIMQRDNAYSGNRALVTGASAGSLVGSNDIDGGITSIRSAVFELPANYQFIVKLAYYFAHLSNTTAADFLRITVVSETGNRKVLLFDKGKSTDRVAEWKTLDHDISDMAGNKVWLLIEAADGGSGSIVEAAVDNIRIEQTGNASATNNNTAETTGTRGETVFKDNFDEGSSWTLNPLGDDTASAGQWNHGIPETTRFQAITIQPGPVAGGGKAMVTGYSAGATVGSHDIDGGKTTVRSPLIRLPAESGYQLTLDYYFAHLWNTTDADYLHLYVVTQNGQRQPIFQQRGQAKNQPGIWKTLTSDLSEFSGQSIYLDIETADGGTGSIVEAAFDNLRITYQ
ncbi:MAG: hypothetical protein ACPGSM_09080, partial [Thiolinea sp.]